MSDVGMVECSQHGKVQAAFVCQHLYGSIKDRNPVGVNWLLDEEGSVNGWCDGCEDKLGQKDDQWDDEMVEHAKISLICKTCFDDLETFNEMKELD